MGFSDATMVRLMCLHFSGMKREGFRSLKQGEEVRFDIIHGEQGLQADQSVTIESTDVEAGS